MTKGIKDVKKAITRFFGDDMDILYQKSITDHNKIEEIYKLLEDKEQPVLDHYDWIDIGGMASIGGAEFICGCGTKVTFKDNKQDDRWNEWWECPNCGKKITWTFKTVAKYID